jgi:hydroxymethylglutaryl-CoA reductase (NADPH)
MSIRKFSSIDSRLEYIKEKTGNNYQAIKVYPPDLKEAQYRNCENMVGAVQIPLGIAGPLKLKGKYVSGEYYLPLATTEGALIASVNRGCKAITSAGGAKALQELAGITRGPVFAVSGIEEGLRLKVWIDNNLGKLKEIAKSTSGHLELLKVETTNAGKNFFIRFSFDTKDAMGMNMATIATDAMVKYIEKEQKIRCISLAGNFDTDKKPAWINFILGRGRKVWAEVELPEDIVKNVLKTTSGINS